MFLILEYHAPHNANHLLNIMDPIKQEEEEEEEEGGGGGGGGGDQPYYTKRDAVVASIVHIHNR